jgi:hypothetical protein
MAESRPNGFDRFGAWYFSPRGQLVCFLVFAGLLALCVWTDDLAREYDRESLLAPTRGALWLGIEVGAAVGVVPLIAGAIQRLCRVLIPARGARNAEPSGWRLWAIYCYHACFGILLLAMVLWCLSVKLAPFPPMFATIVVNYLGCQLFWALLGQLPRNETVEANATDSLPPSQSG